MSTLSKRVLLGLSLIISLITACDSALEPTAGLDIQKQEVFPEVIPLPDGFQPEGVVVGRGPTIYAGSLANGSVYRANLRTGEGELAVPAQEGRIAVGLTFDNRTGNLFVAGGPAGEIYVYDTKSGNSLAAYDVGGGFVNDVIVTKDAAYFTDSFAPVYYRVPLAPNGGLPDAAEVQTIPLSGDFEQVQGFNSNGIEATPNGDALIIVNSTLGALYKVEPDTGVAARIDLGGETVTSGDGILLNGFTLYVLRNRLNQIAVIELAPDLLSGNLTKTLTDDDFRVPTTLDDFGNALYAVNARFGTPPTPETDYEIVRVRK